MALPVMAGCATAPVPAAFRDVPPAQASHAFIGYSGTELEGYAVDGPLGIPTPGRRIGPWRRIGGALPELGIGDDTGRAWSVRCGSVYDNARLPPVWGVCLYTPVREGLEPMSLVMTASLATPLAGVFITGDRRYWIRGTPHDDGVNAVVTAGLEVGRDGQSGAIAFFDVLRVRPEARFSGSVDAAERRALAPLYLALIYVRDRRSLGPTQPWQILGQRRLVEDPSPVFVTTSSSAMHGPHGGHAAALLRRGDRRLGRELLAFLQDADTRHVRERQRQYTQPDPGGGGVWASWTLSGAAHGPLPSDRGADQYGLAWSGSGAAGLGVRFADRYPVGFSFGLGSQDLDVDDLASIGAGEVVADLPARLGLSARFDVYPNELLQPYVGLTASHRFSTATFISADHDAACSATRCTPVQGFTITGTRRAWGVGAVVGARRDLLPWLAVMLEVDGQWVFRGDSKTDFDGDSTAEALAVFDRWQARRFPGDGFELSATLSLELRVRLFR